MVKYSMGKIGYAPEWGTLHTKIVKDFEAQRGEQKEQSPKFKDVDKAMKWLNGKP